MWIIFFLQWHTYFTEREKSPGALSLSLMRKAPSFLCLFSISSALARGIFPKNHLREVESRCKGVPNEPASRVNSLQRLQECVPTTQIRLDISCWWACVTLKPSKNVLLAVEPLQIYECEKIMTEERSVTDKDGRRVGETKPVKSSLLV